MSTSPDQLRNGFIAQDQDALKLIYTEAFPSVKKFVKNNSGTENDALDIFQEAVLATWMNMQNGRYTPKEGSSLHAYIIQVARHKWLDELKSGRRRRTTRLSDEMALYATTEETENDGQENMEYLQELYATLGEQCRRILSLFYYEKATLETIASQLNYDAATIRTMKYRCMMKLRKEHLSKNEKN